MNLAGLDFVTDIGVLRYAIKAREISGCYYKLFAIFTPLFATPFACGKFELSGMCKSLLGCKLTETCAIELTSIPPSGKEILHLTDYIVTD